jgi:hypothetical protein
MRQWCRPWVIRRGLGVPGEVHVRLHDGDLLAGKHPFLERSDKEHLGEILDLLGTADIKEWSGYNGI